MSFRDEILSDLHDVFINEDEHATLHTIDGKKVICIVDDDKLSENKIKSGTYKGTKMIHVPLMDLDGLYVQGASIEFDGEPFVVSEVVDSDGMITLTLDINSGY